MTIPVVRKRAKKPKTRTGCRTCRARHIKCDEGRPACRKCIASNRECAGYDIIARGPAPKGGGAPLLPKTDDGSLPILYPLAKPTIHTVQISTHEAQAYDFFRFQTVNQLPGSSWTLSWQRLALETGHREPAITHAAIALGSLHRSLAAEVIPAGGQDQQHFALSQYNKALGFVRRYIETLADGATSHDVEVVLLVSLLFFCFEILHGEDKRATLHLQTGLRILYERVRRLDEYRASCSALQHDKRVVRMQTRPRTNMDVLLQTFVRLDGDLTIIGAEEPFLFPVCNERIPMVFYSIEEAMVRITQVAHLIHLLTCSLLL